MRDDPRRDAPPLTPTLLLGMAVAPLPPALLQPVLDRSIASMARLHPAVFERLGALGDAAFRIEPTDLPFVFRLAPGAEPPRLTVLRPGEAGGPAVATLRAPFGALLALIQGRLDGDALFFGRDLAIEGDVEAVLMLRNAVDGAVIDLVEDLTAGLGPLAPPARWMVEAGLRLAGRIGEDFGRLQSALLAPLAREVATLSRRVERLGEQARAPSPGAARRCPARPSSAADRVPPA